MEVTKLKVADPPTKNEVVALLEKHLEYAKSGKIFAIAIVSIEASDAFYTSSAGNIKMSALAGFLSRAWMDAVEAMK